MNTPSHNASILNFLGMHQRQQTIIPSTDGSVIAREILNARPYGGSLQSVLGSLFHSSVNYKAMKYLTGLFEIRRSGTLPLLMATGWDTIFKYDSATWTPLGRAVQSNSKQPSSLNYFVSEGGIPDTHRSWINSIFYRFMYNDKLYLGDGINRGMKYDDVNDTFGLWGVPELTGVTCVLRATEQVQAGNLTAGTYTYTPSLYDNTNSLEGNPSAVTVDVVSGGATKNWIHLDLFTGSDGLTKVGNYDFHNQFTDYIRIYRNSEAGVTDDNYLLHDNTAPTGVKIWQGSGKCLGVVAITGVLTKTNGLYEDFTASMVDQALYIAGVAYRIKAVAGVDELTITDADDDTTYSGGAFGAGTAYWIVGGWMDNDDVIDPADHTRLFTEDTTTSLESRDHSAPVKPKYCVVFGDQGNRAFYTSSLYPNRVYYSQLGIPDYCPVDNWIEVSPDDGDYITGLVNYRGTLLVFRNRSVTKMSVQGDVFQWYQIPKWLPVGAIRQDLITDCNGMLIFVSLEGVWGLDGSKLTWLSHNEGKSNWIDWWGRIANLSDDTPLKDAVAHYDRKRNEYNLFVAFNYGTFGYDASLEDPDVIKEGSSFASNGAGGVQPQANGCMVYGLTNGQWFQKDVGATAVGEYEGNMVRTVDCNVFYEELSNRRTPKYGVSSDYDDVNDWVTAVDSIGGAFPVNKLTVTGTFTANEFSGGRIYITVRSTGVVYNYIVAKMDSAAGVTTIYVVGKLDTSITQYDYVVFRSGGVGSVGGIDTEVAHAVGAKYIQDSAFTFTADMVGKTITWYDVSADATADVVITSVDGHKAYGLFALSPISGDSWAIVETDADETIRFNWSTYELAMKAVPYDKKIDGIGLRGKGYSALVLGYSMDKMGGSMTIPLSPNTGFTLDDVVKGVLDNVTYTLAVEAEVTYIEQNAFPNFGRLATLNLMGDVSDQVTIYEIELYYRVNTGHRWR